MKFRARKNDQNNRRRSSGVGQNLNTQQYYKTTPKAPEESKKQSKIMLPVVVICILLAFAYNLIVSPTAELQLNSQAYRPAAEYQAKLEAELGALINRNKLTIDSQRLEDKMRASFPEISSIGLQLPLVGKALKVDVAVSAPSMLLMSGLDKYVVDKQGRAVVKNTTGDTKNLVRVNDQTGFEITLGEQVLASDEVSFISYLAEQARSNGLKVREFVLPSKAASELYMYQEDKPYYVKFFLGGSADAQLGTYLALKEKLSDEGKSPEQYIDVRVEEKAFVR